MDQVLQTIKPALTVAPALASPHLQKSFFLFVCERLGDVLGVLTQALGPTQQPVAYFSKNLAPVAQGWSPGLRGLVSVVL